MQRRPPEPRPDPSQDFLSLAEATVCVAYPHSAKAYLVQYEGMAGKMRTGCRKAAVKGVVLAPHQREALAAMKRTQQRLCAECGPKEIDPATALALDPHHPA